MSSGPINSGILMPGGRSGLDADASPKPSPRIESTGNKRKANRQACKPCRQAKSRCDGTNFPTEPCSRCARLNLICDRDSEYKRVNKKTKYDELVQQVRHLQSVVNASNTMSDSRNDGLLTTEGLHEQAPDSPRVLLSDAMPFSEQTQPRIQISLNGDGVLSESTDPNSVSYQTEPLTEPPYQGSISFQTMATAQSLPESRLSGFPRDRNVDQSIGNNCRTKDFTPVSQHQMDDMEPTTYSSFQQAYTAAQPRSIGSVYLTSDQVCCLFKVYFENYHPYFSLLDPDVGPDDYYSRCTLLYWTIISIASHRFEDEPTLLGMLSHPVQTLLWDTIRKLPHSPFVVEAIILFSMWPFPTSSMWMDPSFLLISIAKTSTTQLGLHRPENIQDFSRVERQLSLEGIQDSVRIWASCYIAAQCITSSGGHESIVKPDQTITQACEPNNVYRLPLGLHHYLRLIKFSVQASNILSENTDTPSGQPDELDRVQIMDRLEHEFDELKGQLEASATNKSHAGTCQVLSSVNNKKDFTKVLIYCIQLQLRVFYFFEGIHPQKRKEGLLKCYQTASTLIETILLAEADQNLIVHAPYQMYRLVLVAGIVLMRVLNSSYSNLVDFQVGRRNFNASIRLLRQCSLQDNDNPGRGSKILSQLWIHYQNSPTIRENPPNMQIRTRLGASVLHDSLWTWRRECDEQKKSRRGTRQNSPHKSPRQDWTTLPTTNAPQSSNSSNVMNDMVNFSGIENLDTSWLEGTNLLSWFPVMDGPTI